LSKWFQTRRFLWEFPIGSYVKLSSAVAAILVGGLKYRTQIPKLCLAVALSHQDGHHSAVALLLKAALIQVSDYRFLGASGLILPEKSFLLVYAFKETTGISHRVLC
jgi:hypothetical protein